MRYILEERYILCEAEDFDLTDTGGVKTGDSAEPKADPLDIDTSEIKTAPQKERIDWKNLPKLPNKEVDWGELYSLCKTSEDFKYFWNAEPKKPGIDFQGYYKEFWKDAAGDIKKLPAEFTETLKKYGWEAQSNPIVACLQHLIKLKVKITPEVYGIVHNAAANHLLTSADLTQKGTLGDKNIIFLPDLYTKGNSNALEYLRMQSKILEQIAYNKLTIDDTLVDSSKASTLILNTMLVGGNAESLLGSEPPFQGALRTIGACKQLMQTYMADDKKSNVTDKELQHTLNGINTPQKAMNALAFLSSLWGDTYKATFDKIGDLKAFVKVAQLSLYDIKQITKDFGIGTIRYTPGQVDSIIRNLRDKVVSGGK